MSDFCNSKVFQKVGAKEGMTATEVSQVWDVVALTMHHTIKQDDPSVSVKLDGLGNLVSSTTRRMALEQLKSMKGS